MGAKIEGRLSLYCRVRRAAGLHFEPCEPPLQTGPEVVRAIRPELHGAAGVSFVVNDWILQLGLD